VKEENISYRNERYSMIYEDFTKKIGNKETKQWMGIEDSIMNDIERK
jgi:hypothetical protein